MIIATIGREVGQGSKTSILCKFTLIGSPVTVVWKSKGRIIEAADGVVPAEGAFEENSQIHTLDIVSAVVDATFTCKVNSKNYPKEAENEKSIPVSVFSK